MGFGRIGGKHVALALAMSCQAMVAMAATPVIGVITASGGFQLDDAQARGNGTLFEGTTVQTGASAGDLELSGGVSLRLGSNARGRVFHEYMELQRGAGEVRNASRYSVRTATVHVTGADPGAAGRVQILDARRVVVTSIRGNLRVTNPGGVLLAALSQGNSLEFQTPSGASSATIISGCPITSEGKTYMTDGTTRILVELREMPLVKVGNRIEVTGSQIPNGRPAGGATQVIQVMTVKDVQGRCEPGAIYATGVGAAAAGAAAAGTAGAGAAAGAGVGTAVLVGVGVSAVALGTAVALTTGDDPVPTVSR